MFPAPRRNFNMEDDFGLRRNARIGRCRGHRDSRNRAGRPRRRRKTSKSGSEGPTLRVSRRNNNAWTVARLRRDRSRRPPSQVKRQPKSARRRVERNHASSSALLPARRSAYRFTGRYYCRFFCLADSFLGPWFPTIDVVTGTVVVTIRARRMNGISSVCNADRDVDKSR